LKASAISYSLEVDVSKFDPANGKGLPDPMVKFECDTYYTTDKVRTINRLIKKNENYDLNFRQRLYDQNTQDEYNIDHENKFMLIKEGHAYKPKATGKKKTILNYVCKEYEVTDFQGRQLSFWVTDQLGGKNVCPWGNFSIKGVALEVTTSFGIHFLATDLAAGELDSHFFDIPTYPSDKVPFPAARNGK
jgi:hypothetical protein